MNGKRRIRLKQRIDHIRFFREIESCKADVWFMTQEGDRLNLKSALSKYLFASISSQEKLLKDGRIECEAAEDYRTLEQFLE